MSSSEKKKNNTPSKGPIHVVQSSITHAFINSLTSTPVSKTVPYLAVTVLILPPPSGYTCPLHPTGKHESPSSLSAVGSTSIGFLLSWCYLYHPAWKFGLYCFHTSVDSAQTAKQLLCKDA